MPDSCDDCSENALDIDVEIDVNDVPLDLTNPTSLFPSCTNASNLNISAGLIIRCGT